MRSIDLCRPAGAGRAGAARTYRAWKKRLPALRAIEDAGVHDAFRALNIRDAKVRPRPELIYGRRKMTQWWRRNGFPEACRHTVVWQTWAWCRSRSTVAQVSSSAAVRLF
jgi:hypothetical protein